MIDYIIKVIIKTIINIIIKYKKAHLKYTIINLKKAQVMSIIIIKEYKRILNEKSL